MQQNMVLETLAQKHNIKIGNDLNIPKEFQLANLKPTTIIIITDTHLEALYLENLKQNFIETLPTTRLLTFTIPSGEGSKCRETKASIEDFLLENYCDRDSWLVALGGGVIGDLIGFTASTYLRGVPLIQIPTTLLSMVDSSIGGKNGVDTIHGKNLIGTFYEAKRNFINLSYLKTLPPREFYNGMAEIIKMAATGSAKEFERLENENLSLDQLNTDSFLEAVTNAIQYKCSVVAVDGKDTGLRQLLNFGHTIGHAIEAILSPILLHGECVSIGMILETKIAIRLGHCKHLVLERLINILTKYKLPIAFGKVLYDIQTELAFPSVERIIEIMNLDKKNSKGSIRMVLLADIGKTVELNASPVPREEIEKVLNEELNGFILKCLTNSIDEKLIPKNIKAIPPAIKNPSFFLCLTLPDYNQFGPRLVSMVKGVDAIEIRVDLFRHPPNFEFTSGKLFQEYLTFITNQIKIIKQYLPRLPIIYTPRTVAEGGEIPDSLSIHIIKAIYILGFYLGCELIDVQVNMPNEILQTVCQLRKETNSKIIASYHKLNEPLNWLGIECKELIEKGQTFGDIIKIVSIANSIEDNDRLEEFTIKYWENKVVSNQFPLIAINAGSLGEITRVKNRYLTPVTHYDLPVAAPGQLTAEQIKQSRCPEVYY